MYINFVTEENKNIYVSYWLLLITFFVVLMIVVGGLTRLTDSGLSITRWNLVSGILPPLSIKDWEKFFSLYKQIPEYKLLNSTMTIEEFKIIYWWEYAHRLLGRLVGLLYLIPLLFFTFKNYIKKERLLTYYLILLLICFQGFVGWYMVKSGLSERTDVSHYKLSLHLTIAFIIYVLLIWNYFKLSNVKNFKNKYRLPLRLPIIFTFLILLQISIGAFVSGLDAGNIYQTWPLMNSNYFPDDRNIVSLFSLQLFETPSLVQFIHRNLAYIIFFIFLFIIFLVFTNKNLFYLKKAILFIFIALFVQIFLGILTILSGAQILLASAHQIGSIFLITASIILLFKNSKIS